MRATAVLRLNGGTAAWRPIGRIGESDAVVAVLVPARQANSHSASVGRTHVYPRMIVALLKADIAPGPTPSPLPPIAGPDQGEAPFLRIGLVPAVVDKSSELTARYFVDAYGLVGSRLLPRIPLTNLCFTGRPKKSGAREALRIGIAGFALAVYCGRIQMSSSTSTEVVMVFPPTVRRTMYTPASTGRPPPPPNPPPPPPPPPRTKGTPVKPPRPRPPPPPPPCACASGTTAVPAAGGASAPPAAASAAPPRPPFRPARPALPPPAAVAPATATLVMGHWTRFMPALMFTSRVLATVVPWRNSTFVGPISPLARM